MTDIDQFVERFEISRKKARKMLKAGVTWQDPLVPQMREQLRKKGELTALHMCVLIDRPALLRELGNRADKARKLLVGLGDVQPAPDQAAIAVFEPEAVPDFVAWLKEAMPADREVTHHYFAVRVLMAFPSGAPRDSANTAIRRLMLNARKRDEFAGWWTVRTISNRRVTFYHRPKVYDL